MKYVVEVIRHRHFAVEVEAESLAAAIVAAQAGEGDYTVMFDGDDELTTTMGIPEADVRQDLAEHPALVENNAFEGSRLAGVCTAYPINEHAGDESLTIVGSCGEFACDPVTGEPLGPVPPGYAHITRVDVAEYAAWCAANNMPRAETVDILLVGYWYAADVISRRAAYEAPEADARADWLNNMRGV